MEKNGEYKGEVLSLGSEGEGIIKCGDITAFVPFCLEGEKVSFKALKVSGGVAYGKLTEVHTLSQDRVIPVCPYFEKCGGCQLQHASYSAQLSFKQKLIKSTVKKIAGIDAVVECAQPSQNVYGYRNKLVIPVGQENGATVVGFFAPRSHRIVPIRECALQRDWSKNLISALLSFMNKQKLSGYNGLTGKGDIRHLAAREVNGKLIITVVSARKINLEGFAAGLEKLNRDFTLWLNINNSTGNAVFGKEWHKCFGEGYITGEDCGVKFKAGANTFLQVNDGVRTSLYKAALKEAGERGAVAIDLYSGGGMLTAMLAKECGKAYGVEIVKEAVAMADELKALNGLEGKMFNICGAVEDELDDILNSTQGLRRTIVCDPPRKGMERSVINAILKSGAEKVVLISCNPATLARDLGLLCGSLVEVDGQLVKNPDYTPNGTEGYYSIVSVTPYDMFPQTKHVETLVVLSHKKPAGHIEVTVDMDNTDIDKNGKGKKVEKGKPQ